MKVLFLDIDGVCNSEETHHKYPKAHFPIDQYMAYLVGKIKLLTGCEVVLSSSWRHHEESKKIINERIVTLYDVTPFSRTSDNNMRGYEIKDWLDAHPEVTKYAILDDDSDMLPEQLPNFFQTDWKVGITREIADKIIFHLGLSEEPLKPYRKSSVV